MCDWPSNVVEYEFMTMALAALAIVYDAVVVNDE